LLAAFGGANLSPAQSLSGCNTFASSGRDDTSTACWHRLRGAQTSFPEGSNRCGHTVKLALQTHLFRSQLTDNGIHGGVCHRVILPPVDEAQVKCFRERLPGKAGRALPAQVGFTVAATEGVTALAEQVSFPVGGDSDRDANTHGGKYQDQNAASECLDQTLAGTCGLGITKSAALAPCWQRQKKHDHRAQPNSLECHLRCRFIVLLLETEVRKKERANRY